MAALRYHLGILFMLGFGVMACSDDTPQVLPTAPTPTVTTPPPAPPSDFIRGWVRDTAIRPLANARVELVTGAGAGVVVTTDAGGEFSLTATVDNTSQLRASKEGYDSADIAIGSICNGCFGQPGRWAGFFLQVPEAPAAIAGNYTLTFTADSACTTLPEPLRTRTYEVRIAPSRFIFGSTAEKTTSFLVEPTGGSFSGRIRYFWVNVAGHFVTLRFGDAEFDPSVIEAVAPYGHVAFSGTAAVTFADSVATPYTGSIEHCVNPEISEDGYRCTAPATSRARCDSEQHQLVMTRR